VHRILVEVTADPSTSLRFGRDDKGESGASSQQPVVAERTALLPLLYASVRMTKGAGCNFSRHSFVAEGTADPSTSLRFGRDDKGVGGDFSRHRFVAEGTADPSASLRSGRDDKGEGGDFNRHSLVAEVIAGPSATLPRISCGTWWRCRTSCALLYGRAHTWLCPVQRGRKSGYAPVGMTIHFLP
jgi:hypothetical protein